MKTATLFLRPLMAAACGVASLAVIGLSATPARAAEAVPELVETMCGTCHGVDGRSASGEFPNLAGQHRAYLVKQLKAFRDKTRTDPVMGSMADPLDDKQIEQLADYFATRKP